MPRSKPMLAVLVTLIVLGLTPTSAVFASGPKSGLSKSRAEPSKVQKINAAIRRTRKDRSFTFFVVCLPDEIEYAKEIHSTWKGAVEKLNANKSAVYFVRGQDAEEMLRKTSSPAAPICIAFRNGQPYHSRTGSIEPEVLDAFLDIALNNSMPPTYSPNQIGNLLNNLTRVIHSGQHADAAKVGGSLLLVVEGYMQSEQFASSYTAQDFVGLTTLYHQTLLQLSMLNLKDPAVIRSIEDTRRLVKAKWEQNTDDSMGIGLWIDLSVFLGKEQEILQWADAGVDSPRVTEGLRIAFGETVGLLAKHKRWRSLGQAIESPEAIRGQMQGNQMVVGFMEEWNDPKHEIEQETNAQLRESARCHASLLLVGREAEAWEVAEILREFVPAPIANAALCAAALEVGTVSPKHAQLLRTLDPKKHASLYRAMNTAMASAPADG